MSAPTAKDLKLFTELLERHRFNLCKLVYIIFPFGEKGHALEHMAPYDWQMEEWAKLSRHLMNPETRYETYRLIISSGNGAAKTAFGAMTVMMILYTHKLRGRITANTDPQMTSIVWPEYDIWFRHSRYHEHFFQKFGTSIKAKNEELAETWRFDRITWNEQTPAAMSGLHNYGHAIIYVFEEGPGIPANIWKYASGAYTEKDTIKLFFAFGNSDDPESKFEQNMTSPIWNAKRIDTRELGHIDPKQIEDWLLEVGGDEDHDDFRVRVRGLPRKSSKDSIISFEIIKAALERRKKFDTTSVRELPVILTCDPAWTGGDETTIAYHQGNYSCLLERYKLDKADGDTHMITYNLLKKWEKHLGADAVFIDQGEGTGIYTLAMNDQKTSWYLISFASNPNDNPIPKDSEYKNIRAQMYYEYKKFLQKGGILDARKPEWIPDIQRQLAWTKGTRHKITLQKLAEPKADIKDRVGQSPDIADVFILRGALPVTERLPENDPHGGGALEAGQGAISMPDHNLPYGDSDEADDLYN